MIRTNRRQAPIALQVVILLVTALASAQLMTLLIVATGPPPRPPVYRLAELAAAFRGGSLRPQFGRPLTRTLQARGPEAPPGRDSDDEDGRKALAALLGVPEGRVQLVHQPRSWTSELAAGRFPRGRPPPATASGLRPGSAAGPRADPFGPPPWARPPGFPSPAAGPAEGVGESPVFGDFTAALQRSDGRWLVLRSTPESWPTAWERRVALWLLGCTLLVAPAGYLFARRITAPIDRFARAAEALGRAPNAPPIDQGGPAEISRAARAFNEMQARIQRYVQDRTAMFGAISHDLRTPLARIRFRLERAPADLKDPILSDVRQMEQMVDSVLAFIRDSGEPGTRQRVDLLSVLECVVDDAAVSGDVRMIDSSPLEVDGDALALQRLFANLVDNAAKYGARARVRAFGQQQEAVVEIDDDGPGLSPANLERVFTPFYRADAARNLDVGGVGLGLAVARSIARAHGGDVTLRPWQGGLTAVVRLPLVKATAR